MNPLNLIADPYERPARLYPALLLLAPAVISAVAILSENLSALQSLATLAVGCGLSFLLTQLARDGGKRCETMLFEEWGGMPSVAIFRHSDPRVDAITKASYHAKLSKLVKGAKAPSAQDEGRNSVSADVVYTAWSTFLRSRTRDVKKYDLLFRENINYGYRRNIYGLRMAGIIVASVSCVVTLAWCCVAYYRAKVAYPNLLGALALDVIALAFWVHRVSSPWVRIPADCYAERLAEATNTIGTEKPPIRT